MPPPGAAVPPQQQKMPLAGGGAHPPHNKFLQPISDCDMSINDLIAQLQVLLFVRSLSQAFFFRIAVRWMACSERTTTVEGNRRRAGDCC